MPPRFNLEDYEPVEERLARFWGEHPTGRVATALISHEGDEWVVRAEVYRDAADAVFWASGYASEITGDGNVNRTSALENCETSAIGRALANAGYAPKGKRPSREEMAKVKDGESGVDVNSRARSLIRLAGDKDALVAALHAAGLGRADFADEAKWVQAQEIARGIAGGEQNGSPSTPPPARPTTGRSARAADPDRGDLPAGAVAAGEAEGEMRLGSGL